MRVAITGPLDLPLLARLLNPAAETVIPAGLGGTIVATLVAELSRTAHEVTVVTLSPGIDEPVHRRIGAVDVLTGFYRPRHRAKDAFRYERRAIRDLLNAVDVDVVHAHWTYEFGLGALDSRHPALITVHDWAPAILRHARDPYRTVRLAMQACCLARARHLTVVSPYIGERLRHFGRGAATLVPNGLSADFFSMRPSRSVAPVPRVLSVNSDFSTLKNARALLRAFPAVCRRLKNAQLVLAGPGFEPGGRAETWARRNGLGEATVFAGPMTAEEVRAAIDASDIFVAPTLEESFGMTVLEAMARGLPVVAGRSSGAVPWLLDFGRVGQLVDVRRPQQIARAVVRLAQDDVLRERLGREGLERAKLFAWSALVPSYEEEYRRVMRGRGRSLPTVSAGAARPAAPGSLTSQSSG
jgi:glycosyltransferase involved in cell wall biosynthesis